MFWNRCTVRTKYCLLFWIINLEFWCSETLVNNSCHVTSLIPLKDLAMKCRHSIFFLNSPQPNWVFCRQLKVSRWWLVNVFCVHLEYLLAGQVAKKRWILYAILLTDSLSNSRRNITLDSISIWSFSVPRWVNWVIIWFCISPLFGDTFILGLMMW